MEPIIVIRNLKKSYKTAEAVKNISFFVKKDEIFGILGPNGAGKTTTLEILEGLTTQTSGKVEVLGVDMAKQPDEVKKRIGVQLQSSEYLPLLTLGELLDLFSSIYGQKSNKKELLRLVNLSDKENEYVKNLSGGQKQRFTIASSLVNTPEILFLDEPTTGLDPAARRDLWELIKSLNERGITIIMTTHFMEEAEFLCNRIAIMDSGVILKIDEPKKLIEEISNSIQVSFLVTNSEGLKIFEKIPDVLKIHIDNPKVILEINSLNAIQTILLALQQNNISFSSFNVKTATLEDVYLTLTGREYEK